MVTGADRNPKRTAAIERSSAVVSCGRLGHQPFRPGGKGSSIGDQIGPKTRRLQLIRRDIHARSAPLIESG